MKCHPAVKEGWTYFERGALDQALVVIYSAGCSRPAHFALGDGVISAPSTDDSSEKLPDPTEQPVEVNLHYTLSLWLYRAKRHCFAFVATSIITQKYNQVYDISDIDNI